MLVISINFNSCDKKIEELVYEWFFIIFRRFIICEIPNVVIFRMVVPGQL